MPQAAPRMLVAWRQFSRIMFAVAADSESRATQVVTVIIMILESRAAGPDGPRAMTPTLILPASQPGFGGQPAKLEPAHRRQWLSGPARKQNGPGKATWESRA